MKTETAYKVIRWIAYVLGGLITLFFLSFFVAHLIGVGGEELPESLTVRAISLFVFLGMWSTLVEFAFTAAAKCSIVAKSNPASRASANVPEETCLIIAKMR